MSCADIDMRNLFVEKEGLKDTAFCYAPQRAKINKYLFSSTQIFITVLGGIYYFISFVYYAYLSLALKHISYQCIDSTK